MGRRDKSSGRAGWVVNLARLGLFVALILLWQAAVSLAWVSPLALPAPGAVFERFASDVRSIVTGGAMFEHFAVTVTEIVVAFTIAGLGGVLLGVLVHELSFMRAVVYPYIIGFSASPRIAFAPLFLIWFGFGMASKIVMGVTIALFPVLVSTIAGMAATDNDKVRLMRALGASRLQTFLKVRMWQALPYIFAGLQTGVVLATVGVVVGEFSGGRSGLGYLVVLYQDDLLLAGTFSAILLLSIVGMLAYYLVSLVSRKVVFWVGERPVT
jgi:NitT/TauT family transport system permease protein